MATSKPFGHLKVAKQPKGLPKDLSRLLGATARLKEGVKFPKSVTDEDRQVFWEEGVIARVEKETVTLEFRQGTRSLTVKWAQVIIDTKGLTL